MRRVFSFTTSSVEDLKANTTQPFSHSQSENIITHKKKKEKIRQKKDITTEEEVKNMEYIEERKKQSRKSYIQQPPQVLKNYSGHAGHAKEKKSRLSKYVDPHNFLGDFSFEETIKEEEHGEEKIKKSKKKSNGLGLKDMKMNRSRDNRRDNRNSTTLEVVDISNNNSLPQGFRRPTTQYGYPDLNVNNANHFQNKREYMIEELPKSKKSFRHSGMLLLLN
ncbi:9049_t:CDS:2 [Diversispora eburnea]|uniref:9049_t:CDS:1 n=1 Tax=Diversispora eburnea TaxID=1213867 RepID=A0A9N9F974_9GLOM|nr:9049_t:CDS:2 [Diversispora eburnea]